MEWFFASICMLTALLLIVLVSVLVVLVVKLANWRGNPTPALRQPYLLRLGEVDVLISSLEIPRDNHWRDHFVEIRLTWPDRDFRCTMYPSNNQVERRQLLGMQSLVDDAASTQGYFEVQSNDFSKANRLLSDTVQEQINKLYRVEPAKDLFLAIGGGYLLLRKHDPYQDRNQIHQVAQMVVLLREQMLLALESGIEVIGASAESSLDEAMCEICGESIDSDAVVCRRCKTPHHRDCWEYYGGCSIYACGETQFEAASGTARVGLQPKRIPRSKGHSGGY